ncbi:MAG: DUF2190 family protein [Phycisphaerae bacterium]|nr:DUF2190 family protein [Phycisphaerae bacterium]
MPARFVQRGLAVDFVPTVNVALGEVVVQGDLVGIARRNIRANTQGSLAVSGVFDIPKATGSGTQITVGAKVYWDANNKVGTASDGAGANKLIGKAVRTASDTSMFVRVRLTQ